MTMRSLYGMFMATLIAGPALAQAGGRPAWQGDPPLAGTVPTLDPAAGRPRTARGPLFISPMGEPFRGPDPREIWFRQADADHDGRVSRAEFLRDADRFFAILDRGHDGEIDPDDIDYYETVLAPEIRTGGGEASSAPRGGGRRRGGGGHGGHRGGGSGSGGQDGGGDGPSAAQQRYSDQPRGAARFGWFDYPEPVVVADTNMNRGVDRTEFHHAAEQRFAALDRNGDGLLAHNELPPLPRSGGFREHGLGGPHTAGSTSPPSAPSDDQPTE